jgi:hypothetical protein
MTRCLLDSRLLNATIGDSSASIHWGDGGTTTGVVRGSDGEYGAVGSYTYAAAGSFVVTTAITDVQAQAESDM